MFRPTPFQPDHDRFYYEPRVFWSTLTQSGTSAGALVRLNQEHFRNTSRFPIRLTKLLLSPVGYLYSVYEQPANSPFVQAFGAAIQRCEISVEYPRGYSGQRRHGPISMFGIEPTDGPAPAPAASYASSLFGVTRWDFDVPYIVPADYAVGLELSNLRAYANIAAQRYGCARAFFERTRSWILGHGVQRLTTLGTAPLGLAYPQGPQPVGIPDNGAFQGAVGNDPTGWSAEGSWPGGEWARQKSNRGQPYTEVTGFGVVLDQRAFDDEVDNDIPFTNSRVSMLATRIATKCRTLGGSGTNEKWWRDGAPLSLVCPTITPAFVKTLEDPIVLGPGEAINVSVRLPASYSFVVNEETISVDPTFSMGVSFAGFAIVEDNTVKFPPVPGQFLPQPMI